MKHLRVFSGAGAILSVLFLSFEAARTQEVMEGGLALIATTPVEAMLRAKDGKAALKGTLSIELDRVATSRVCESASSIGSYRVRQHLLMASFEGEEKGLLGSRCRAWRDISARYDAGSPRFPARFRSSPFPQLMRSFLRNRRCRETGLLCPAKLPVE